MSQEIKCNYCQDSIEGLVIKPCLCNNNYHLSCWKLYENDSNVLLDRKCLSCNYVYNIGYKSFYHKFIYQYYDIFNTYFFKIIGFVYITSLLLGLINTKLILVLPIIFNINNWLFIFLVNFFFHDKNLYLKETFFYLIAIISLYIWGLKLFWLQISSFLFNISLNKPLKKFVYLFSAECLYLELKNTQF